LAGTHDLRSFVGPQEDAAIATLWHYLGKVGKLTLGAERLSVYDVRGQSVAVERSGAKAIVPINSRRLLLHFPATSPVKVKEILAGAKFE